MWDSYQTFLTTQQTEAINQFLYNDVEHPYVTRILGTKANTDKEDVGDDNEDNDDNGEGNTGDGGEGNTEENM